jgi:hypothetical protein
MRVLLRDPTGEDELVAAEGDAAAASRLLDRLIDRVNDAGGSVDSASLSVSEHDRLLAAIFRRLYGDKAVCHATCADCRESFEFELPLDRILAEQEAEAERWGAPDAEGWWTTEEGVRFRAPTAGEVLVADVKTLRALCLDEASEGAPLAAFDLEAALAAAAPTLSIDVAVTCPHCETSQNARFDIARHLARSLQRELPFLVREVHLIASTYGWAHDEIMALTRVDRRAFAGLIAGERSAASAQRAAP